MDKLQKIVRGSNIKHILDSFFYKYIKKHFNQVHSQDYIESDLADNIGSAAKYIKIANGQHIETFLKRLINEGLGDANSYVGLKIEVLANDKVYSGIVEIVQINTNNIVLRPKEAFGEFIQTPATVRLYVAPLLTSNAQASIIYNSIVTSDSKYNFILGERNIHKGEDNVWIFGKNNVSRESNHNSLIDGYNNDVDSYGNLVIGDNNKHRSYYGATIGQKNKNFKKNSFLFGEGHDNGNGAQYGIAFGKYSKLKADTLFAIGDGINESNRHNLFELKVGGEILDKDGNDIRKSGSQVQSDWNETDSSKPAYIKNKPNISSVPMTEITWSALKTLRDTSKLIPGMQYRITDYITITVQENTRSAGYQFDVIVVADSTNKLNENARACLHEGDTHFVHHNLEAWQLKYSLDNNIDKFAWVDGNGKGVIYWMKDEYDNECGYDFKNIKFKRYRITECEKCNDLVGCWAIESNDIYVVGDSSFYFLTFSAENKLGNNNIIKPLIVYGKQYLNNIVIIGNSATNNVFDNNCQNNTLMSNCFNNIFGPNCNENVLNSDCRNNILGPYCTNNCFAQKCDTNTLKGRCNNNVFGISCNSNIFGYYSNYNVLGYDCDSNILRCYCSNNKFYYQAYNNILENKCTNIEIEASHVFYIVVESGNAFIKITSTATTSLSRPIRNIKIAQGVNNTGTYKIISHNTINDNFQTIYKPINSQEIEI
ncbi:MAG: hypothetical protein J6M39_06435 [Lachnospiraceae bacterium]|nr:hypothetical protein [Lachnospiraceae bacterium]